MESLPLIMDIEASGFGSDSYPIEIGVALPDQVTACFLIKPPPQWVHWDAQAESVHGIKRATLEQHGLAAELVASKLNDLLAGKLIYTDAWSHDLSWLGKLYDEVGITQLYRLESLRVLMSEAQASRWHHTKNQVIDELELNRHRASTDALILQETFRRTLEIAA